MSSASCMIALAVASAAIPCAASTHGPTLALADSLYRAAAVDSARAVLSAAVPHARAAADSAYLLELVFRRGAHAAAFGRYEASEPDLHEALALAEARGDSLLLCQALRWLGLAVSNQGRLEEMESLARRQLETATAASLPTLAAWARVALGWCANRRERREEAVDEFRAAIALFRDHDDAQGEAWTLNTLGAALQDRGDLEAARGAYAAAEARAREVGYTLVEALAANNLGTLEYSWGDPGRAVDRFERAHALLAGLGHAVEATRAAVNIALCQMALGQLADAAARLRAEAADPAAMAAIDLHAHVRTTLGDLRRLQGRPAAAKSLWREVVGQAADLDATALIDAVVPLAETLAAEDSTAAALALMTDHRGRLAGIAGSIHWQRFEIRRGALLAQTGRPAAAVGILREVAAVASRQGAHDIRAEALMELAAAHRLADRPDSALALLARAIDAWEHARRVPLDPQWREARGARGSRMHTEWARLALDRSVMPAAVFARLQRYKARTLWERMQGPGDSPAAAPADLAGGPVDLAALQRRLAPHEVFLDVYVGPAVSLAFAVTDTSCRVVDWPAREALDRCLGFFRRLHQVPAIGDVTADETAAVAAQGRRLGRWLLGGLAGELAGRRRVILCPDGPIHLLPWASLVVPASAPDDTGAVRDLADLELVTVPSATVLTSLRTRGAGSAPSPGILAVASADDLPAADHETRWLARSFAHVAIAGGPALAACFPGRPEREVLHVAAHVQPRDDAPWRSAIRLGAGDPAATLTAAEVAGGRLASRLAVLAGCESAGGRVLSGEGIQGLTGAFLSAGVPSVVATLWPVDDGATAAFVQGFYAQLAAGRSVAASLAAARRTLRRDPATAHPFFWAGYVVVGDGDLTVALAPRAPALRSPAVLLALAAAAALAAIALRRRRLPGRGPTG